MSGAKVKPIPEGYHTITPHLIVRGADRAIAFYKEAFGAEELGRMASPDGSAIHHAEVRIGDSLLFLCDEFPELGARGPQSIGDTTGSLFLYVEDVDAAFARAVEAGAKSEMPPADMFWGDRYAKVTDPFGHKWSLATHIEDVPPEQLQARAAEAMAGSSAES